MSYDRPMEPRWPHPWNPPLFSTTRPPPGGGKLRLLESAAEVLDPGTGPSGYGRCCCCCRDSLLLSDFQFPKTFHFATDRNYILRIQTGGNILHKTCRVFSL